jgi:hypothetical protein
MGSEAKKVPNSATALSQLRKNKPGRTTPTSGALSRPKFLRHFPQMTVGASAFVVLVILSCVQASVPRRTALKGEFDAWVNKHNKNYERYEYEIRFKNYVVCSFRRIAYLQQRQTPRL